MKYTSKIASREIDDLFKAILQLETQDDCYRFFDDIATYAEVQSLAQRWQVARMLNQNETYSEIVIATGASTATISRVKKCLDYGAGGYTAILKKQEQSE